MSNDAMPRFIATCWTSGGNIMPARTGDFSPVPIERRIQAIAHAGFTGFGITHADLTTVRDTIGYGDLAALFRLYGIRDVELEYVDHWWLAGERRAASDRMRNDLLEAAHALGARHIKAGLGQVGDHYDRDVVYGSFNQLADDAHAAGTKIALEPAAFSMTPTIEPASDLVRTVANASGGLLVDIWHIYRSGMSYVDMVDVVPAEYVFAVELNDGAEEVVGSLYEDTFDNRLYPGDGVFGVDDFIRGIRELGYDGPWGLEMMSRAYRELDVEDATQQVIQSAVAVFRRLATSAESSRISHSVKTGFR